MEASQGTLSTKAVRGCAVCLEVAMEVPFDIETESALRTSPVERDWVFGRLADDQRLPKPSEVGECLESQSYDVFC